MENNKNDLRYKVVMTFFESPNFNLTSDGETVELARVCTREAAELFVEAYALEILRHYNNNPHLKDFSDCGDDEFEADFEADPDGNDYCIIQWNECIANIFTIIELCPNCGCDPTEEPYALAPNTHCPQCGYVFENNKEEIG